MITDHLPVCISDGRRRKNAYYMSKLLKTVLQTHKETTTFDEDNASDSDDKNASGGAEFDEESKTLMHLKSFPRVIKGASQVRKFNIQCKQSEWKLTSY